MTPTPPARNRFAHLAKQPGPRGWQNRAARELGYTKGYLSKIVRGLVSSRVAEAAIADWKARNL